MIWFRLEQSILPLLSSSNQVWGSQAHLLPTELMLADALTKALCNVKFAKFAKSILIQDTRLDQSGSVEDQASAAQLVLKQAHAS
jgi:hypothetical protein